MCVCVSHCRRCRGRREDGSSGRLRGDSKLTQQERGGRGWVGLHLGHQYIDTLRERERERESAFELAVTDTLYTVHTHNLGHGGHGRGRGREMVIFHDRPCIVRLSCHETGK